MSYADADWAVSIYGLGYVTAVCDRNLDGSLDTSSFDVHLELASARVDAALRGRIALPLEEPVDLVVKKTTVDLAVYNCCPTADVLTTEIKARYEAAECFLRDLAANKVRIKLGSGADAVNESAQPSLSKPTPAQSLTSRYTQFVTGSTVSYSAGREFGANKTGKLT